MTTGSFIGQENLYQSLIPNYSMLFFMVFQWEENKEKLNKQANVILKAIQQHTQEMHKPNEAGDMPSTECIDKLFNDMCTSFDDEYGGYGGAPKFPQACE